MYTDEIAILDDIMAGYPIKAGTMIGPIGNNGFSTADHSHVEIESWGYGGQWLQTCAFLDYYLSQKFGDEANLEQLTEDEIFEVYKECEHTADWKQSKVMDDFRQLRRDKKVLFINKHKIIFDYGDNRRTTVYSTHSLFGM